MVKKISKTPKQLVKNMKLDVERAFENKRLWHEVGGNVVKSIKANMVSGKGATSEASNKASKFDDVNEGYKKYRKPTSPLAPKSGYKSKLINSGKMHKDMDYEAHEGKAVIGFNTKRSAEIAEYHDKLGVGKSKVRRPFFNITKAQFNLLQTIMKKLIDKTLKK